MLILSNCLTEIVDEGCLKVANSLVRRIKKADSTIRVISYERKSDITDIYVKLNKFMYSRELASILKKHQEPLLYIPFPARTLATALRIFLLSLLQRKKLSVILVMKYHMSFMAKALLYLSRADIVVFSKEAADFYAEIVGNKRVTYLQTGVDTQEFVPVSKIKAEDLKVKYGLDRERLVVLHVGHLNYGRNVDNLMKLDKKYQILLVTSTFTKDEQDIELRKKLVDCSNIRLMDEYIENINEIYQLSDVYFFPVVESGRCIDVPLSVMEAASCNKPIVTTDYGQIKEFKGYKGFYFIDSFEAEYLNGLVEKALAVKEIETRQVVVDYDWEKAVSYLLTMC